MIDQALQFIVKKLNGIRGNGGSQHWVSFPAEAPGDSVKLMDTAVTVLLVRIEEERIMRQDEPYFRFDKTKEEALKPETRGRQALKARPPVVLHLYILFAARWSDYATGLKNLSDILSFFQAHPVFKNNKYFPGEDATDDLDDGIPELRMELHTPTFTVQNEIWSALKAPLHPSVMYKMTLVHLEEAKTTYDESMVLKDIEPSRERLPNQNVITNESPIKESIVNHPS